MSGSLGAVIGSLLDIGLFDLAVIDKGGQKVGHTLVGKLGERRALFLNLLDALEGIHGDEEGEEFSAERFVLYLRSGGLAGSGRLLVKKVNLMLKTRLEFAEIGVARASVDKGNEVGEEIALSHGSHSGLLKEDIEFSRWRFLLSPADIVIIPQTPCFVNPFFKISQKVFCTSFVEPPGRK